MTSESSALLSQQAATLVDEAVLRHRHLLTIVREFSHAQAEWNRLATADLQNEKAVARARADELSADIRQRAQRAEAVIARDLRHEAQRIAPGAMSLRWDNMDWATQAPDSRPRSVSWIRLGSLPLSQQPTAGHDVPEALVPLFNTAGWSVGASPEEFSGLVQGVLLRLFSTVPLHRLEITVFDPGVELQTGVFAPIRDAAPQALRRAITQPEEFDAALDDIVRDLVRTTDELSNLGVTDVEQHWRAIGSLDLRYRLIVVNSYPQAISRAVNDALVQIARMAGSRGASLIVRRDPSPSGDRDFDHRALTALLTAMEVTPTVVSVASLPNTAVTYEGAPPRHLIESVVDRIVEVGGRTGMPALPLADLLAEVPDQWGPPQPDGLRAVFGREQRRPLELRLLSAGKATPHALIGGATGQGKSNLLLAIIHALAMRYRPQDLRMYLLDFREGVELSALGPTAADPTWLPHAEVLGLESDREFGLSVLQHLVAQFAVRSAAFREAGVSNIVDYLQAGGEKVPRILLVIDEFQVLLDGDDETARRSVECLQQLAQKGRGYGIHLLLASQTTSGIRGLATKGDAIFSQFANRLSLKNTAAESQAILGPGNKAAASLAHRGEVVINEDLGAPEKNRLGVVAHAEDEYLADLRRYMWRRSHGKAPLVFVGSRPASWDSEAISDLAVSPASGAVRAWVARPIAVDSEPIAIPIGREADQSVLIAGPDEFEAAGVLSSMMASIALQAGKPMRWIVLDGASGPGGLQSTPDWLEESLALARAHDHEVLHLSRDKVRDFLIEDVPRLLADRRDSDPDVFVFLIAPQRVPDLETPETGEYGLMTYPKDNLQRLVREGSPRGVHLIGWWSNMRTATAHLNYQTPGIGAHILFGLGRDELQGLLDPRQPLPHGHPRVIVKDPRSRSEVRIGIPFEPMTSAIAKSIEEAL